MKTSNKELDIFIKEKNLKDTVIAVYLLVTLELLNMLNVVFQKDFSLIKLIIIVVIVLFRNVWINWKYDNISFVNGEVPRVSYGVNITQGQRVHSI